MSEQDRGPLIPYQIIWKSGHIETIEAHQVLIPLASSFFRESETPPRLIMHGEIDGRWGLILDTDYNEVSSVRRMSPTEVGGEL